MAQYSFVTTWHLAAPAERVWGAIYDIGRWPEWWRYVARATQLAPGHGGASVPCGGSSGAPPCPTAWSSSRGRHVWTRRTSWWPSSPRHTSTSGQWRAARHGAVVTLRRGR